VPPFVRRQSGSLSGTRPIGAACNVPAWSSDNARAGPEVPGLSMYGATNGVQPMRGSMILVSRASSEALLMIVAVGFAARLAAVSCAVEPSARRRYCVGTLSDGQASVISNDRLVGHGFPRLSFPRGGMTVFPAEIPALAAANQG
jgi:hypothetical protein